ncbi:hypothetical protein CHUAL_007424 [Chamberlinius hualienensis]
MTDTLKNKHLKCKTLNEYLKELSGDTLERLYEHSSVCLAVFREVPELARHFILLTLSVDQPIPQAVVVSWVKPANIKDHVQATQILKELRIWVESTIPGGLVGWILNPVFRKSLRTCILGGPHNVSKSGNPSTEQAKHARDVQFLDSYAMERWECVLHYMVGAQTTNKRISADAIRVLLHAGLMKNEGSESSNPVITPSGFQFLLMDTASQVWFFIVKYLETLESRKFDLVECLAFLFQLSLYTLGQDYSTEGTSDSIQEFLQHLREFGLVYQRKRSCGRYYPTRLATGLASGTPKENVNFNRKGYIVVETNYRLYAYTESDLEISLIGLFSELIYRFPNLLVAVITRDRVRQALQNGITAEQIITFLKVHAHPEPQKTSVPIPPTVTDQIRLWELERDRFTFTEGVLYDQFLTVQDFETLRNYARDMDVLIWDNPANRVVVVSRAGHDSVKKFWKRQKQSS